MNVISATFQQKITFNQTVERWEIPVCLGAWGGEAGTTKGFANLKMMVIHSFQWCLYDGGGGRDVSSVQNPGFLFVYCIL